MRQKLCPLTGLTVATAKLARVAPTHSTQHSTQICYSYYVGWLVGWLKLVGGHPDHRQRLLVRRLSMAEVVSSV